MRQLKLNLIFQMFLLFYTDISLVDPKAVPLYFIDVSFYK